MSPGSRDPTWCSLPNLQYVAQQCTVYAGNLSEWQLEKIRANIHRLVRDTDEIDEFIFHDIEDDVAAFAKTPVTGMNVIPLAASKRILRKSMRTNLWKARMILRMRIIIIRG